MKYVEIVLVAMVTIGNTLNTITAFTIILNNHGYHNQQQWGGIFSQLGRSCCFDSTVDCNVKTWWNNYLSKIGTTTFISNYRIVYSWQGLYETLISTRQWLCFIDSSLPCNYCRITGFCSELQNWLLVTLHCSVGFKFLPLRYSDSNTACLCVAYLPGIGADTAQD